MIVGIVNTQLEGTLRVTVVGPTGLTQELDAVIDTGFSGELTLPTTVVTALGLTWLGREEGVLADGRAEFFDVHAATILWNGQLRSLEVQIIDTQPLLGMRLMDRHALLMNIVPGGTVTLTPLP